MPLISTERLLNVIAFAGAAGTAALVTLALIPGTRDAIDWGQAPGWVTAGVSVLAFTGVLVTLLRWQEDRQHRLDDEANQARLVQSKSRFDGQGDADSTPAAVEVRVQNRSSEPIFDVFVLHALAVPAHIDLDLDEPDVEFDYTNAVKLTQSLANLIDTTKAPPTLAPGEESQATRWTGEGIERSNTVVLAQIVFTDARGRRWKRIASHSPERAIHSADGLAPTELSKLFP